MFWNTLYLKSAPAHLPIRQQTSSRLICFQGLIAVRSKTWFNFLPQIKPIDHCAMFTQARRITTANSFMLQHHTHQEGGREAVIMRHAYTPLPLMRGSPRGEICLCSEGRKKTKKRKCSKREHRTLFLVIESVSRAAQVNFSCCFMMGKCFERPSTRARRDDLTSRITTLRQHREEGARKDRNRRRSHGHLVIEMQITGPESVSSARCKRIWIAITIQSNNNSAEDQKACERLRLGERLLESCSTCWANNVALEGSVKNTHSCRRQSRVDHGIY